MLAGSMKEIWDSIKMPAESLWMSHKYNLEFVKLLHLLDQMTDIPHECLPWHVKRVPTKNGFHYRFSREMTCDEKKFPSEPKWTIIIILAYKCNLHIRCEQLRMLLRKEFVTIQSNGTKTKIITKQTTIACCLRLALKFIFRSECKLSHGWIAEPSWKGQ